MGFKRAVTTCFQKYADFKGRASRSEFWFFFLFFWGIFLGLYVLGDYLRSGAFLAIAFFFAAALPKWAVAVRRLHDIDKPGSWVLLAFIPLGVFVLWDFFRWKGTEGGNRFGPDPLAAAPQPASV